MTTQYKVGDVVDLLDGGNVVGKGTILHMGPNAILHNQPLPSGHFGMSINAVYKADVEIPYPPPQEDDIVTLGQAHNYIIAWPRFACAECMFSNRVGALGVNHSAYGPYLCSVCVMVVHWNAFGCIWRASMLSKCTQCPTIAYTDHKYGPYTLW